MMPEMLVRIDDVLRDKGRKKLLYVVLTSILFFAGIACIISALVSGKFLWSVP